MPNDSVAIRSLAPSDVAALQDIRAQAFAPVFASFRTILGSDIAPVALASAEKEQADLLERLCAGDQNTRVFVAERSGEPIGFVSVILDPAQMMGEIGLNAVLPREAGRGVGAALYEHALSFMRREGMRVAFVGAGADPSHASALHAYEKAGFRAGIPSLTLYRAL